jgi:hypothetical protein
MAELGSNEDAAGDDGYDTEKLAVDADRCPVLAGRKFGL